MDKVKHDIEQEAAYYDGLERDLVYLQNHKQILINALKTIRENERGLSNWDKQKTVPNIFIVDDALQQVGEEEEE
jgi:hypothetical protein